MNHPENLMYTSEHEWVEINGKIATIGITDFAQSELGDIIFLEFPNVDESFNNGDIFGTIEAVKTVSDMYMPITGKVIEINEDLNDTPEQVNEDPYKNGWMVKIELEDSADQSKLMDAESYIELIG
ncbi:MAG: glycine cleavage system protein GcvH [Candidatus Marinimicrobia bacterium]|nr:glycine cleavage system protein GcvH [Candidatus Neomarinimicrobiota bacterium]MBT3944770.1 glycine cleavage system protein GcvH [Candidatus Neomarinimicrobiota bacterium]MBT4112170.1 glycine cleavage system protein GcvH [Candidatus Neomarinimicrobiota bacterium]MBT4925922.1 glycine cleavage system protein GcvH [Candidatus Neomarinimicrobiota bacterium]MBT5251785.1 glycine cleavage system protein GcvH [Candidatus Neomarinimicrobiota bacterium]